MLERQSDGHVLERQSDGQRQSDGRVLGRQSDGRVLLGGRRQGEVSLSGEVLLTQFEACCTTLFVEASLARQSDDSFCVRKSQAFSVAGTMCKRGLNAFLISPFRRRYALHDARLRATPLRLRFGDPSTWPIPTTSPHIYPTSHPSSFIQMSHGLART
eukprot:149337-Chlamydomonas_euryale.AAC.3